MRNIILFIVLILIFMGCNNINPIKKDTISVDSVSKIPNDTIIKSDSIQSTFFKQILDYPIINDTSNFIKSLIEFCNLSVEDNVKLNGYGVINSYKKVKLYGSNKDFIFIEYDYRDGCMATYPWKFQMIFTPDGKLIETLEGQRFEFVKIFPNLNPFLLIVVATAKGNGVHYVYKITADTTLENVYEGYSSDAIQTYDAHQDMSVYKPNELKIQFIDENKDGYNDIIFTGKKLMLGKFTKDGFWYEVETINHKKEITYSVNHPGKIIPIRFVFIYNKKNGHFKAKEDYNKKYQF